SLVVRHVSDHLLQNGTFRTVDLVSNFLTWVHDDVRWGYDGPTGGMRTYLSAGYTRDVTSGEADFGTLLGEAREYVSRLRRDVWASRAQGQSSLGPDAQRFFLNGRAALRGYERRAASGQQTAVLQNEVRLPLLRGLTLAIPAPWTFPTISGGAFTDAAWVWEEHQQSLLGSTGFSVWIGGGFLPALRWNVAWLTDDFVNFHRRPGTQFTIDFNY